MTIDWTRREMICGGLLTVIPMAICPSSAHAQVYEGCWIGDERAGKQTSEASPKLEDELIARSGIDGLELAPVQTLDMLSSMFGVLPGFVFYREPGKPNAKATNRDLTRNRPDGTVMLGIKLVSQLLALKEAPDAAVTAVCAHEFAHILSYSNGTITRLSPPDAPSPLRSEQFADYMAGYFAGRRKLARSSFPAVVFATTTQMYGGVTHGTSAQRGSAVQEGFFCAYLRKLEPQAATKRALEYALSVPAA